MLRTIITVFYFFGYAIVTIPKYVYARFILKNKDKRHEYAKKVVRTWITYLFKGAKTTITATGEEHVPEGPALFVANHQSMIDIPALLYAIDRPLGFVAKKELSKVPLVHHWISETPSAYIDRKDIRQSMKAIITATDNLKKGYSMAIFPEGTRSTDGVVKPFKKGSLKPAQRTGVPIVPVALENTYELLVDLPKLIVHPQNIKVTFLEPIYYNNLNDDEKKDINVTIQKRIAEVVEKNSKQRASCE